MSLMHEGFREFEDFDELTGEVMDLWELTLYVEHEYAFEFGYFRSREDAEAAARGILFGKDGSWLEDGCRILTANRRTAIVYIRPEKVGAVEIGHPLRYEAEARESFWPEGYSPSWRVPESSAGK